MNCDDIPEWELCQCKWCKIARQVRGEDENTCDNAKNNIRCNSYKTKYF